MVLITGKGTGGAPLIYSNLRIPWKRDWNVENEMFKSERLLFGEKRRDVCDRLE